MAEPMDVSAQTQLGHEDVPQELMDTSSSSCANPETSSDSQVVTSQPAGTRSQPVVRTRQAPNQHQTSTSAPESSETTSRKHAADQKTVASTGKADAQPSAPLDVAVVHMKVNWPESLPEKWKIHLEIALQTWCNYNADGKVSAQIQQLLDDGRTAEVAITPSSVLKDLQTATLTLKHPKKTFDVLFQKPEKKSSSLTSENLTDEATLNLKGVGAPSNQGDAETTKASAPLTVPHFFYCYLSQVCKQEVENIEKTFGVNIKAETCISIFAKNTNQKNSSDSVSRATEAFTDLYQKTTKNLKTVNLSQADMESDIMKEILHNVSHQVMLNMSANEHLLFGQDADIRMVTNRLSPGDGAGVTSSSSSSSSSHNTSHSMEMSRSYSESMRSTRNLNMVLRDASTRIEMVEAHWKLLTSAFELRIFEIQNKFGVEFQAEPVQGLMTVSARSSRAHQVNLEAHALSALTHLYQKVVTSAMTCYLTDTPHTRTSPPGFKEVLAQHTCVQRAEINGKWRLFGLPKHLVPAVADMEKDLGKPVCHEESKKRLENLWKVPQASRFQRGPVETDVASGARREWRAEAELPGFNQKFSDKAKANDKENESEDNCPICLDKFTEKKKLKCGHEFCRDCLQRSIESSGSICPMCKSIFGVLKGDQPDGTMCCSHSSRNLPGYPACGTIEIHYSIPSGIQTRSHPNPGQHFSGTSRTAYLPNNAEGNHVLRLLRRAFDQKLIFTVGISRTSGTDNMVIWNDVHHKTSATGGPQSFGYPDPGYLKRVKEELKAKGIE